MSLLEDYQTASALTQRMLEAARVLDWDELAALGTTRDKLLASMPKTLPAMPIQDGREVARLIEGILACHAEIGERAGPWLDHAATLLAAFDRVDSAAAANQRSDSTEMQ